MTINEIAKLAKVSRATVSRYLNNGYVSEEKRKVIKKVIEETGYEPSAQAQNLRKRVTRLIGVIIPRIQSDSVSRMVAGISSILSNEGYQLLLANTQNNEQEELNYLKIFKKNNVDGIIFMGTIFSKEHFRLMNESEVPIVVIGQQADSFSCVFQDDYHAAKDITRVLLKSCREIGYIGVTAKDKAAGAARRKGFLAALKEHKIPLNEHMTEADFGIDSGYEKAKLLFEVAPCIDSLFCATDAIAIGAMKYLKEKGIKIPSQVQLTGFGDTDIGRVVDPSVTTVHYYYKTSGIEAARLLLEILNTGNDMRKSIKMGYEIITGLSTRI